MDDYIQSNQALWDEWTGFHEKSKFYDVEGFKAGRISLDALEQKELGDVSGKSLLHLQCHFGMDTLSWARLGARVTGADFSDKAIALARSLSEELGIEATFVRANIYDLPDVLDGTFDIVFTSYGVLYWLPDMQRWAEVVAHFLKPGGTFYVADAHPFAQVYEANPDDTAIAIAYPYFQAAKPLQFEVQGSYAAPDAHVTHGVEYGWLHSLGKIITSLTEAGLHIEFLHEFPYVGWACFGESLMEQGQDGLWRLKDGDVIPLTFSLKATKAE